MFSGAAGEVRKQCLVGYGVLADEVRQSDTSDKVYFGPKLGMLNIRKGFQEFGKMCIPKEGMA